MGTHDKGAALVLTGADVYTMDAARRWAKAIAVRNGSITAVGTLAEVISAAGAGAEVLELRGGMVLPGFQDAHVHALFGGLNRLRCDLHDVGDLRAHVDAVAAYARAHPEAEWILGGGWAMDAFPGGTPHRELLDAIVPDRPVYLQNRDVHGAWVNSKALELAGISASTADPSGGRIERDASGEPSGTLHEHAMDLVEAHTPPPTAAEKEEALRLAQAYLHSLGITAWQDPWITEAELEAYAAFDEGGELTAHVCLDLLWDRDQDESQIESLIAQRRRYTRGRISAGGVKIFQDGVVENFTAGMLDPYLDGSGHPTANRGISMVEPAALNHFVKLLDESGFQVHFHAIGDRAVRESLDALESALRINGPRDARHHICHLQVVHPDDIARFRELGVVANCQPFWAYEDSQMRDLTIPFLGAERSGRQYPFASLRRSGATLAFGSDWSVSTPDPLLQIDVAVNRVPTDDRSAEPFLAHECLDLPAALEAFTIGSAFVNRRDEDSGSIEAGKAADLVVLDRNLFGEDGPPGEARVLATFVDGQPVYTDSGIDW